MSERICYEFYKPTDLRYRSHAFRYYCARGFVEKGWKVLDLGCGCGFGCELLSEVAGAVIGVDYAQGPIEHAKKEHSNSRVRFFRCSAENFQFPSPADMTVLIESLEHFKDPIGVLNKVKVNTKHRIFVTIPLGSNEKNPHHMIHFPSAQSFTELMKDSRWYMVQGVFQKTYPGEYLITCWERLDG